RARSEHDPPGSCSSAFSAPLLAQARRSSRLHSLATQGLGPLAATKSNVRVPRAPCRPQRLRLVAGGPERRRTRALAPRVWGPSLVRRRPYGDPAPVPSRRPPTLRRPGLGIYLARETQPASRRLAWSRATDLASMPRRGPQRI